MTRRQKILCIGLITMIGSLAIGLTAAPEGEQPAAHELLKTVLDEKGVEAARTVLLSITDHRDSYTFDERAFWRVGKAYLESNRHKKADFIFQAAVELFPRSLRSHRYLAHLLYRAGHETEAKAILKRSNDLRAAAFLKDYLAKNRKNLAASAEEVIARSIEATGGRAAWEAVKTMVVTIAIQDSAGNSHRLVRMYKRPAFFRQGMEGSENFTATDGRTFWRVRNGQWSVNENFHLRLVSMDNWLIGFEDYGISHEFVGFHFINGPLYHLRRTFADGYVQDLYFSTTSNLLTEEKADYIQVIPFMKSFMSYWDYRDAGGVKIPHVFIRNMGGLEPPHGAVIEEVKINVPLADSLFVPPDDKK